jgi:hypothetical protein
MSLLVAIDDVGGFAREIRRSIDQRNELVAKFRVGRDTKNA